MEYKFRLDYVMEGGQHCSDLFTLLSDVNRRKRQLENDRNCIDISDTKELKTSEEWNKKHNVVILDPDGWDRKNYDYSFNIQRITEEEFLRRLSLSTQKL